MPAHDEVRARETRFYWENVRCAMVRAFIEGSFEAKLPTIWIVGKAQPGRSSDMETVRREKIRDGEDQRSRKSEERRYRCADR